MKSKHKIRFKLFFCSEKVFNKTNILLSQNLKSSSCRPIKSNAKQGVTNYRDLKRNHERQVVLRYFMNNIQFCSYRNVLSFDVNNILSYCGGYWIRKRIISILILNYDLISSGCLGLNERTPSSAAAKRGLDNFQIVVYFQRSLTEMSCE